MATLRRRLYRKNDAGTYDTVHVETDASLVYMSNGNTVENQLTSHVHDDRYYTEAESNNLLNNKANAYHTHDTSQIVSGILPQYLGGTGYNSLDQLKNALGISNLLSHEIGSYAGNNTTSITLSFIKHPILVFITKINDRGFNVGSYYWSNGLLWFSGISVIDDLWNSPTGFSLNGNNLTIVSQNGNKSVSLFNSYNASYQYLGITV